MIYLENSTEEQTIYIPRENTDIQSIKPISPNIPSDVLAGYYTKIETDDKFATKEEVNEKVANLQEQIDNNGGGSTSNVVYIYAQEDNTITDEQWLDIVQNHPNQNYKIVLYVQSFEENGKEYKAETIVDVIGVNYEQYPQLEDNNGTIYNDCTLGWVSGVHDYVSYTWSREFGEYGFEMYVYEEGIPSRQEVDNLTNIIYETADAIVPKIYYIDKNSLSLEDFNNIKNEVRNSKVILNFDGQNVEIIKTTDNALYAINCYWENENDTITYNELTKYYLEDNSSFIEYEWTTSNITSRAFTNIFSDLKNNKKVYISIPNEYQSKNYVEIIGYVKVDGYEEYEGYFYGVAYNPINGSTRPTGLVVWRCYKEYLDDEGEVSTIETRKNYIPFSIEAFENANEALEIARTYEMRIDKLNAHIQQLTERITALENN